MKKQRVTKYDITVATIKAVETFTKNGFKQKEIAQLVNISESYVSNIMMLVNYCRRNDVESLSKNSYKFARIMPIVCEYCKFDFSKIQQVKPQPEVQMQIEEIKPEKPATPAADNTAVYLCKLLENQEKTNKLLEQILQIWGG